MTPATSLLQGINQPEDLKRLDRRQLNDLAEEPRSEIVRACSVAGGHLASSLGAVELTVALHYLFDSRRDRIVWDVGHQTYGHKILTGRKDRIDTIRQAGGRVPHRQRGVRGLAGGREARQPATRADGVDAGLAAGDALAAVRLV